MQSQQRPQLTPRAALGWEGLTESWRDEAVGEG